MPENHGRTPRSDRVGVWQIDLDDVMQRSAAPIRAALSPEERLRSALMPDPVLRSRFEAARGAARHILGQCLGRPPARLTWHTGRWGKPRIAGHEDTMRFNLSHSGGHALLAVTGPRDIGVDLERSQPSRDVVALSHRYFPAEESALVAETAEDRRPGVFLTLWTRKEACTKAAGTSMLGHGLRLVVTAAPVAEGAVLAHDPTQRLPGRWLVHDISAPAGHGAAVALEGDAPAHLTIRQWEPQ
ncbi:4'-phosphopantetheinyl transferase family protein [Streptomyces marianii]|uniref:4'-phosphopantetheinyl transferase superfamily protein n=1 Tax=Streptomyces marianii TaxID=1817406 RepID=A0A5R9EGC5_9ACTN|nr:4'-phosphopantetheinyl transferase superfamily protein [Streptomyces marianii]TLQ47869.1 4'-phosphopantetheinyl transferase superfamily protein [Streptomyces marianii]